MSVSWVMGVDQLVIIFWTRKRRRNVLLFFLDPPGGGGGELKQKFQYISSEINVREKFGEKKESPSRGPSLVLDAGRSYISRQLVGNLDNSCKNTRRPSSS